MNNYTGIPVNPNNESSVIESYKQILISKLESAIDSLRSGPDNQLGIDAYYKNVAEQFEAVKGPIDAFKQLALDKISSMEGGRKRSYKSKKSRRTRRR
jgi:hypothetical protein